MARKITYRLKHGWKGAPSVPPPRHPALETGPLDLIKGFIIGVMTALLKRLGVDWAAYRETLSCREAELLQLRQAAEMQTDELLGARAVRLPLLAYQNITVSLALI